MQVPKKVKKFDTSQAPPVDWLWASVLERQKVYGLDLKSMSKIVGVEYGTMRQMINRSPWEWKRQYRENVCQYFGINIAVTPQVDGRLEVNIR